MVKLCLDCFEIYKNLLKRDEWVDYQFCPKISCQGKVVEVDELMLSIIIELNKKCYITEYCCAGHYYDRPVACYIKFWEEIQLPYLPSGYKFETEGNTIRKEFGRGGDIDNYKYFNEINDNANQLLKWAKSLPFNDNFI